MDARLWAQVMRADPQEYGPARQGVKPGPVKEDNSCASTEADRLGTTGGGEPRGGARARDGRVHGDESHGRAGGFGARRERPGGLGCDRWGHVAGLARSSCGLFDGHGSLFDDPGRDPAACAVAGAGPLANQRGGPRDLVSQAGGKVRQPHIDG